MPPSPSHITDKNASASWSQSLQAVLDQPPSTLPSRLILAGLVFSGVFGLWTWFGKIQVVSHATGRLTPQGEVYKVQPAVSGEVVRILVKEGQTVTAGQLIAELDSRFAKAEVERLQHALEADQLKLLQIQELINQIELKSEIQQKIARSQIQSQAAQLAEARANAETQRAVMDQLELDRTAHQQRIERLRPLVQAGAIAQEQLFEVEQSGRDRQRALVQSKGELAQSKAAAQRFQAELAQQEAQARHSELMTQEQLHELKLNATELTANIQETKSQLKTAQTQLQQSFLHAPVDGVVFTLNIDNVGEVLQPGRTVAEVAPENVALLLSAALPAREAGFVKLGMPVTVKLDAFPFQDYGMVSGKLISVSPDTTFDEKLGAVYRVKVELDRTYMTHRDQRIQLKAGETGTAEIIVRQQRIIDILLDPFRKLQKDSLNL